MRTHTQSHKQYIYRMLYFGQETMQCTHTPNNGSSTSCRQVVKHSVGSVSTSPKNEFFFFLCLRLRLFTHQVQNTLMAVVQIRGYRNLCTIIKRPYASPLKFPMCTLNARCCRWERAAVPARLASQKQ